MARTFGAVALILFLSSSLAMAKPQTIKFRNGGELTGEIKRTDAGYQVTSASGGTVVIPFEDVDKIIDANATMQDYLKQVEQAKPSTADEHYAMAEWAFDRGLFEAARTELEATLAIQKDHLKALLLLRRVDSALASKAISATQAVAATKGVSGTLSPDLEKLLVSDTDIAHIRIQELRKDDVVPIEFRNGVRERFMKAMRGREEFQNPQADVKFLAMRPVDQALRIREQFGDQQNAWSWLNDIVIKADPKFMVEFRNKVWPVVSQNCATAECHGGEKANGGYRLFNYAIKNDRLDYTNFVILDGVLTKSGHRLVDRDRNEDSLILQFGLPSDQAKFRHPKPLPFPYVFASRDVPTYVAILNWLGTLKAPPHPDYALKYNPPSGVRLNYGVRLDIIPASVPVIPPMPAVSTAPAAVTLPAKATGK